MKTLLLFTFLVFNFPNSYNGPKEAEWDLAKQKNNIKIYTRTYENSAIQEFKAITFTSNPIASLEKTIENVEGYTNWQLSIGEVKILKRLENNDLYVWYSIKLPWPFTDRDMITMMHKSVNEDGVITYKITNAPDYIAVKEDLIRIREAEGKWQLTPMPNGEVKIHYQFYAHPAGNLPEWVINLFIVDAPYQSLTNLLAQISDK